MVLIIKGKHHYLWCAVDQDGHVLDIVMQSRRNRQAAKRFLRKLLNRRDNGERQMRRFKFPGLHSASCHHTVRSTMLSGVSATLCRPAVPRLPHSGIFSLE